MIGARGEIIGGDSFVAFKLSDVGGVLHPPNGNSALFYNSYPKDSIGHNSALDPNTTFGRPDRRGAVAAKQSKDRGAETESTPEPTTQKLGSLAGEGADVDVDLSKNTTEAQPVSEPTTQSLGATGALGEGRSASDEQLVGAGARV